MVNKWQTRSCLGALRKILPPSFRGVPRQESGNRVTRLWFYVWAFIVPDRSASSSAATEITTRYPCLEDFILRFPNNGAVFPRWAASSCITAQLPLDHRSRGGIQFMVQPLPDSRLSAVPRPGRNPHAFDNPNRIEAQPELAAIFLAWRPAQGRSKSSRRREDQNHATHSNRSHTNGSRRSRPLDHARARLRISSTHGSWNRRRSVPPLPADH